MSRVYSSGEPSTYDVSSSRYGAGGQLHATQDLVEYLKEYAREKPEVAALWCLGIGFVLGWKLKPW
jgi:hypothetical protein